MYSLTETKRQLFEILRAQLDNDFSSFLSHYRDLGDFLLPRRPRFTLSDVNRGDRRNQKIVDNTGTLAMRTLKSGLMSGLTNPARPWFGLTTPDPMMAERGDAKKWLHRQTSNMLSVFLRSNVYNTLSPVYADISGFGTGAMYIEPHAERVIHTYSFPVGSYRIATSDEGYVNVFFREFRYTVRQMVKKFGVRSADGEIDWTPFSSHVRKMWEDGHREEWIDICHVILPNDDHNPKSLYSKDKKFTSCYYERGTGLHGGYRMDDRDTYLSEKGYDYFPILVPRWETTGEDMYGTNCPGMEILGDVKALQLMQKRKAEAVEKMVRPPMTGPTSLKTAKASILPGDITFNDESAGQGGFKPSYQVDPRVQELLLDIQDHQQRIRKGCHEDAILAITSSDRASMTATEVEERREEKLIAFGPVLTQLNQDLFDPLIDITYAIMEEQGLIEEAPEELQGQELKVEYRSIMHQAQKAVGISGMERYVSFLADISTKTGDLTWMNKVNKGQFGDVYGDGLSVNPAIINSDEEVAEMEAAKAKQQQQMQAAEMAANAARAAKDLAGADMGGDNALTRLAQGGQGQQVQ